MDREQRDAQFTDFVAARSRALLGTAYPLTGDRQRGEDLLQTALLKTYLAWPRLRDTRAVEAYVRRTLVTTSVSWWRRRWHGELPTAELPDQSYAEPDGAVEQRSMVWPHLLALPPRQRAVVVLRFYEDLTEAQIAEQMGCSVGTVKSQSHRALASLRDRRRGHGGHRPRCDRAHSPRGDADRRLEARAHAHRDVVGGPEPGCYPLRLEQERNPPQRTDDPPPGGLDPPPDGSGR